MGDVEGTSAEETSQFRGFRADTIDDSGANNDHEEREITDPTIASELRILELAEQLEERLFVAFLHSKVTIVCSIQYVCDCKLFIRELNKVYLWLKD